MTSTPAARVWTATVAPARVLARFDDRGESEYVLDTRSLRVDPA